MKIQDVNIKQNKDNIVQYIVNSIQNRCRTHPYTFILNNKTLEEVYLDYYTDTSSSSYIDSLLAFNTNRIILLSSGIVFLSSLSEEDLFHLMLTSPIDYEKYNIGLAVLDELIEPLGKHEVLIADIGAIIKN